jgi:hypothetical protein
VEKQVPGNEPVGTGFLNTADILGNPCDIRNSSIMTVLYYLQNATNFVICDEQGNRYLISETKYEKETGSILLEIKRK